MQQLTALLLSAIVDRASKRAYDPRPVEPEKLATVLEAARWAPSPNNSQSWRFVVVQDPAVRSRLHPYLSRGNQAWMGAAPVVVAVCANPGDDVVKDGQPYYLFSCGLAAMSLMLQAVHSGLLPHPTSGWDEAGVKSALGIPDPVRIVCLIALGYAGDPGRLDPETRAKDEKPRVRKPLHDIVFFETWAKQERVL